MLESIICNTKNYIKTHNKDSRKKKGQFFTSLSIAKFMAEKASFSSNHLNILEPGAGTGLLAAAIIEYCMENKLCSSFFIQFVENDPEIRPLLKMTVDAIKKFVSDNEGDVEINLSSENYIIRPEERQYDIVISITHCFL